MTWTDSGQVEGSYLRVRVTNEPGRLGTRPAENVRAQVETVWVRTPSEPGEPAPWVNLGVDVTPLTWSSRRDEDHPIGQQVTVIASGSTDYTTFAGWNRQRRSLVVYGARADDQQTMQGFGLGEYRLRIVLTANGLKPLIAHVKVIAQQDAITEVEPSHEPDRTGAADPPLGQARTGPGGG